MIPLALAASLLLADQAVAEAPSAPEASAPQAPTPMGAPSDDYEFVAWCYGALAGYLELHDTVMPEVTRIESTWRRPGSKLADDLAVYDVQMRQGRTDLKRFRAALTAAEKASVKPINMLGAAALQRGHAVWNAGPDVSKARLAEEWMSWTLPARCPATAAALETRAKLLGASLQANIEPQPEPAAPAEPPAPDAAKN
jgi:hypothetical protein